LDFSESTGGHLTIPRNPRRRVKFLHLVPWLTLAGGGWANGRVTCAQRPLFTVSGATSPHWNGQQGRADTSPESRRSECRLWGVSGRCEDAGFIALNDVSGKSLPMARPPRTVASRFGTPLPAKLAASVTLFETTATFLALMILNDSVLSWLGLDYVVSAPWRWPLFWLLSL